MTMARSPVLRLGVRKGDDTARRPLLAMADGLSIVDTAKALHVKDRTVRRWRKRFKDAQDAVAALADAP
jgi:transposase-like protein